MFIKICISIKVFFSVTSLVIALLWSSSKNGSTQYILQGKNCEYSVITTNMFASTRGIITLLSRHNAYARQPPQSLLQCASCGVSSENS